MQVGKDEETTEQIKEWKLEGTKNSHATRVNGGQLTAAQKAGLAPRRRAQPLGCFSQTKLAATDGVVRKSERGFAPIQAGGSATAVGIPLNVRHV